MGGGLIGSGGSIGLSRRAFLERIGLGAVAATLPGLLASQGWLDSALAQTPDLVQDTLNGLVAFVVPGPDAYSVAQGQSSREPGGIDAKATEGLTDALDRFLGTPVGARFPSSAGVAGMLNSGAVTVNPAATRGGFPSPFARLSFAEKIQAFQHIEQTTEGSEFRYVSGVLIATVAFLTYSEYGVLNQTTRELTGTPVGWRISAYDGIAEGRADFKGYYQGRRSVQTSPLFA